MATKTATRKSSIAEDLMRLGVCDDAIKWARRYTSAEKAWRECKLGDWMLWLAWRLSGEPWSESRRPLVLAACECARLSLRYVPKGEKRPLRAIQTAGRWGRGDPKVTPAMVLASSHAAAVASADAVAYANAAHVAAANAAAVAFTSAAYAAEAAAAAARAPSAAASPASSAAASSTATAVYVALTYAASADVRIGARQGTLAAAANIVRRHFPKPPLLPRRTP